MRKTAKLVALLAIVLCAGAIRPPAAKAQYLGTTSPQTEQVTLANALPCTGVAQNFTTGIAPGFQNLGQTQHFATATSPNTVTQFRMVIQGIDNLGNVSNISDVGQINGSITASGYFPNIRIAVTCLPAVTGTFTLSYSGTSATPPVVAGSFLSSLIDKLILNGASASVNQTVGPMSTPFGSSAGRLMFQFKTASNSGSTVTVGCRGSTTIGDFVDYIFPLANVTSIQSFSVPAEQCPNFTVVYTSGGAAGTALEEYIFDPPGALPSATQLNGCQTQPTGLATTLPISIGANATQQVVVPLATFRISSCTLFLTVGVAGTVQITEGTGAACGTGTVTLSGAMSMLVGTPLAIGGSAPTFATLNAGDGLCITTAGGATAAGMLSFIYIPI